MAHNNAGPGFAPGPASSREEFYERVIAGAVEFSATRFLGRGRYDTRRAENLAGAQAHARDMGADRTMIYAIDKLGRQVLVEAGGKRVTA